MECLGLSSTQSLQALSALLSPQEEGESDEEFNVSVVECLSKPGPKLLVGF